MLVLEAGLFGTFTALNFFHWFLFWELSLIPAFFLIKLWGGAKRGPAATQFFVYTMAGSVGLLLAFLAVFLSTGSMDFTHLSLMASTGELEQAVTQYLPHHHVMMWLAIGVLAGFAVKVPLMPFHTWLPAAYSEAPSPVTMLLTGTMSKMGVYGLLRIALPMFGHEIAQMRTPLLVLAVLTVVMGAWAAAAQKDLKRVFAYSSVNHLGYCQLGIFALAVPATSAAMETSQAAALNGVILQMFNHGITAAALFWFIAMIQERTRRHSRHRRFRRPAQARSGVRRADGHRAVLVAGIAGPERIRRRVPDLPRRVSAGVGCGNGFRARPARYRGRDPHRDSESIHRAGAGALGRIS